MDEFKHWEKKASGWVFLSHASEDYELVKIVRNYLEENGFSALMFYLKCLEKKENKSLIKPLISEEIKTRNIFVLCKSDYTKDSEWVKWEFKEVNNHTDKIIKEIDVNKLKYNKATALSVLDELINLSTLYFIYHSDDSYKVDKIYKELNSRGFKILKNNPKETSLKKDKKKFFESAIDESANQGTVLIFLSENDRKSKWFWEQKELLLNSTNKNFIIPVVLDNVSINSFPAFKSSKYLVNNLIVDEKDNLDVMINKICEKIGEVRNDKKLF